MGENRIDFVILTALQEELEALLEKFPFAQRLPPVEGDIRIYYRVDLPITLADGTSGIYQLVLLSLLGMGRVQAANATNDAVQRWHPHYILLVGIAGGIAATGIHRGDIIVADQVVDYEQQKLTSGGEQLRWEVHRVDPRLLEAARHLEKDWIRWIKKQRPLRGRSQSFIGPVATGDKVVATQQVLERYRNDWPKLVGLEMEAGGVVSSTFQAVEQPGFLMIRGISDLADEQKDDTWRAYACHVAAAYAFAFLQSGPVPFSKQRADTLFTHAARMWQPSLPPATMLRPEYGVVPFWGRQLEVTDLKTWCETDQSTLVRLYLGAGGIGKTRFLLHCCQLLRQSGWRAGFLKVREPQSHETFEALFESTQPLLLVLDYAEHRRQEVVSLLAAALALPEKRRFRLVMLARSAGEWVHLLQGESGGVGDLMMASQKIYLGPLAKAREERIALFNDASSVFATRLGCNISPDLPDNLNEKHFERVLLLHVAALAVLEGIKVKGSGDSLLDFLLNREMLYWIRRARQLQLPEYIGPALRQAIAVITLIGGVDTPEEALAVTQRLPRLQGIGLGMQRALVDLFHECYPGEKWIEPLQPDLLGEYLGDLALSEDATLYDLILGPQSKDFYDKRC